jgi:hypothetical protein
VFAFGLLDRNVHIHRHVDRVPTTARDARLDLVLTEREAIDFRGA